MIVQGIADCVFEENDQLVIVDYKTDHVKTPEELCERYREQLRIYAYALSRITGLTVRQCLLYSFALGREIEVTCTTETEGRLRADACCAKEEP